MDNRNSLINFSLAGRSHQVSRVNLAILILGVLYTVGIIGVLIPIHPEFVRLTPINLFISLAIVLLFHPKWNQQSVFFLMLCYSVGLGAEIYGVQTGRLFGDYTYGPVLGPQVLATPLIIGINWIILAYCSGVAVNHLLERQHPVLKAFLASLLMVGIDVLIEPVAIRLGFWEWTGSSTPPLQNFLGWWLVAFPILISFMYLCGKTKNKVAIALFCFQFLFFLTIYLF